MARPADPNAREALLQAASEGFARSSLLKARIEDLTSAVGLSKGAFYLHFKTKEDAFRELLNRFMNDLAEADTERLARNAAFFKERGQLTARDVRQSSARYRDLMRLEIELDEKTLELLWKHRLTLSTLLRGAGGTEFEGMLLAILEHEVKRIEEQCQELQRTGCSRDDIPPQMVGEMIVGTYFLVATRMIAATEKPDLRALANNLHRMIHEGLNPQEAPARAKKNSKTSLRSHA
ncbi:MAG: TetR/AcrR family transcriptional regulator [Deltaproteobacteria bacterium]|nr:TetR/AcrR family transcriptional regulator [Deltaproteobacteria bacterium]